jgi:hypothetical protein
MERWHHHPQVLRGEGMEEVEAWGTLEAEGGRTDSEEVLEAEVGEAVGASDKGMFLLVNGEEGRDCLMVRQGDEALAVVALVEAEEGGIEN